VVRRRNTRDHQTIGIAAQRLLQELSQFRFSIGNVRSLRLVFYFLQIRKPVDYFAQREQTLVNVNWLLCWNSSGPSRWNLLRSCKIDQLKLWCDDIIVVLRVDGLDCHSKNCMRPGRSVIQIMRSNNFILNTIMKKLKNFFRSPAFEYVEVFNRKLIFFGIPDPQSFLIHESCLLWRHIE